MMMNPVVAPTYNVTGQTSPQLEQRDGATVQVQPKGDVWIQCMEWNGGLEWQNGLEWWNRIVLT